MIARQIGRDSVGPLDEGHAIHPEEFIEAHAGKVAKVSTVTKPGTPKTWEIVDTTPIQSPDTDGDWGTSVGNNGWMCDD